MKIDKKNYKHWLYLVRSGFYIVITLPLRWLPSKRKIVVLYGHKLNGNIKALLDYYQQIESPDFELYFLTLDPNYFMKIKSEAPNILHMGRLRDVSIVSRSKIIITDHGLHTLGIYARLTNIAFVDVWHGVPFKGFIPEDFSFLRYYQEIWTTSPFYKNIYKTKLGLRNVKIEVTGYGRVDAFVNKTMSKKEIFQRYNIDTKYDKYILIAPTWKQDNKGRSILPFSMKEKDFFEGINEVARQNKALVIFRTHLNSKNSISLSKYSNLKFMPYAQYPVAEDFLYIADILVTDWSSIGFDYLPLQRPIIYMDVPSPFKNGYTLGPEFRYGDIAGDYPALLNSLKTYLRRPELFTKKHKKKILTTINAVYGKTLDGKATERYFKRLRKLLVS